MFQIASIVLLAAVATANVVPSPINFREIKFDVPQEAQSSPNPNTSFFRDISGRIINGKPAQAGQFPWQVALNLRIGNQGSFCGGALIDKRWVLTAAHCIDGVSGVSVVLGTVNLQSGGQTIAASNGYIHGDWDSSRIQNDIAMLKLASDATLGTNVQVIKLSSSTLGSGQAVTISGWGKTSDSSNSISQTLNYVGLNTITNSECSKTYPGIIQDKIVCTLGANSASTCNGDSGGPLVTGSGSSAQHVGIVSFGSSAGCAKGYPAAFTRTASYISWINSVIQQG